jgi:hypothetical protein
VQLSHFPGGGFTDAISGDIKAVSSLNSRSHYGLTVPRSDGDPVPTFHFAIEEYGNGEPGVSSSARAYGKKSMRQDKRRMQQFAEHYERWFREAVPTLGLPPWTSLEGNLYWIQHTYNFALDIVDLVHRRFGNARVRVLDLGAGKGFLSLLLSTQTNIEMFSADIAPNLYLTSYVAMNLCLMTTHPLTLYY